ncbi:DUF58 domain-containing protein [Nocardia blacklockiae]|uniref:DUF58 domain-containing protein n=1 Tax=Nocardia blacklockiae TaxID=480036 RepID=UPI001893205C|nr:DUF58 domain-containing protein [Nocardia blacklockiae]MBF6173556.1 DUF58 domain-containing protein [Nocardia blacklockiae]
MVVTGRLAVLAAVAATVVTAVLPTWWGVLAVTGVLCALAAADLAAVGRITGLEVAREPLTTVRSGRTVTVETTVLNRGPRTLRGQLWDDWPDSAQAAHHGHPLRLPPNSRTRLTTTLRPEYRGDRVAGPVTLRLLGPLGLAGRQFRRDVPARLRALPPFRSEGVLASKVAELHLLEGSTVVNARGQGSEFDSFREYVAGDDVRAIDWRATARAADVLVRTWRPERHRRLLLVLDTGRLGAGRIGDGTRLDVSIEAALLLGGLAAAAGDTVDLLAYDRQVRAEVFGTGGKGLQPKLMHALAGVVPALVDTDTTGLVRTAVRRSRRRSLIVWFTSLDGAMVEENLRPVLPVLTQRHRVLIVSVTDPDVAAAATRRDTLSDIYTAAAAETLLAERTLTRESLRRTGVGVVAAPPDQLPAALADEYLELKRSGAS